MFILNNIENSYQYNYFLRKVVLVFQIIKGEHMRLDCMRKGQRCRIKKMHGKGKLMHKLLDMGFVNGTEIEVLREAPLYDPMELKIQHYLISLRKSEANILEVELI